MSQSVNRSRPWNTPYWFMLGIAIVASIISLVALNFVSRVSAYTITGKLLFSVLLWPAIAFVDTIIYRIIRSRIRERKWVWAHLMFSLLAYVVGRLLYAVVFLILTFNGTARGYHNLNLLTQIQFYGVWSGFIIGHIFFLIAIIQSFSKNNAPQTDDPNDFLSELPG